MKSNLPVPVPSKLRCCILGLRNHTTTEVTRSQPFYPSHDNKSITLYFSFSTFYQSTQIIKFLCSYFLCSFICLNCKSFPFTILLYTLLCREKYCLQVVYTIWAPLLVHYSFKQDIVKATQPPSVDAIQKFNSHTIMRH